MHEVTWETPVPFEAGFLAQIFVPRQIETPRAANIECYGKEPLVVELYCELQGNRVTVWLETSKPVEVNNTISIQIGPMTNPASTKSTDFYKLSVRTASFAEVAEVENFPGSAVTMQNPSQITDFTFDVFDTR